MTDDDHDNGWTLKTLERYLSGKIASVEATASARAVTDQQALLTAMASMDRRLEAMNEFRQSMSDQRMADEKERARLADQYLTKEMYDEKHRNLEAIVYKGVERTAELDKKLFALSELKADKREGVSTRYMNGAIVFAGLSFLLSLLGGAWGLLHTR